MRPAAVGARATQLMPCETPGWRLKQKQNHLLRAGHARLPNARPMNSGFRQARLLSPWVLLFACPCYHYRIPTLSANTDCGIWVRVSVKAILLGLNLAKVLSKVVLHVASDHAVYTQDDACRSAIQLLHRSAFTAGNCLPGFRSPCGAPSHLHGTAPQRTRSLHCDGQDSCRRDPETRKAQNILQAYAKDNKVLRTRSR